MKLWKLVVLIASALLAAPLGATTHYSVATTGSLGISTGSYAAGTQPMRWEARIHNFGTTLPSGVMMNFGVYDFVGSGTGVGLNSGGCCWGGDQMTMNQWFVSCCGAPTGVNGDLLVRVQRDTAGVSCGGSACATLEVCWTLGGYCASYTNPITVATTWPSAQIEIVSSSIDVAFIRWFPTVVQAGVSGTSLINPISVSPPSNPSSLIADWELQQVLTDSSGHLSPLADITGAHAFVATPKYAPVCVPGVSQSARAGSSVTLSSYGSMALDGGATLSQVWQQVPGVSPVQVQWTSSQTVATPTAVLPQFGPYNFQLTVIDGSGQSSTCVVHDGAVATDSNGVVIYPPSPLTSAANQFLGPLIQWGKNPWPWYDTVHQIAADINRASLGPPAGNGQMVTALTADLGASDTTLTVASTSSFGSGSAILIGSEQMLLGPNVDGTHATIWQRGYRGTTPAAAASGTAVNQFYYWNWWDYNAGPGTVTVTSGSAAVTGVGTHFRTGGQYAFCDSGGNPLSGLYVVIWHPTDTAKTGRQLAGITGCASDTQLTMSGTYSTSVPTGSGLTYSIATNQELYWLDIQGDPRTINYYDNTVGYYLLWLRSGIDTYLIAARQMADTFYFNPLVDQGYEFQWSNGNAAGGYPERSQSNLGLWLRAKDSPQVDMTTGMERILTGHWFEIAAYQEQFQTLGDNREAGYGFAGIAEAAALDSSVTTHDLSVYFPGSTANMTNVTYAAASQYALASMVDPVGTEQWSGHPANYWYTSQDASGDWPMIFGGAGVGSVALTNGSPTVTGTSTTWDCTNNTSLAAGQPIWFWHGAAATFPSTNAGGDSTYYTIASCDSTTQLTLTAPYSGVNCATCGYQAYLWLGWGNQPYMEGIATRAMHYAASAMTGQPAANARALAVNANTWLLNNAVRSDTHGLNYLVNFVNCQPPLPASSGCAEASTITNSLGYSAEGLIPLMSTYAYNGDAASKAAADALYNQMWANPNVACSGPCNNMVTAGGNYMTQLDVTLGAGTAFMLSGIPAPPKWFGQYFGFGDYSAWPAVRLGGVAPSATRQIYIGFSLASVPNAAKVVATVTDGNGSGTATTCTASPCVVTAPRSDQSAYSIQMQYQSSGGAVLAASSQPFMWME